MKKKGLATIENLLAKAGLGSEGEGPGGKGHKESSESKEAFEQKTETEEALEELDSFYRCAMTQYFCITAECSSLSKRGPPSRCLENLFFLSAVSFV